MSLIAELNEAIGLGRTDLERVIATAPARYKVYSILKRNGGERIIAHPARELKAIQRFLLEKKLGSFPVHDNAMAYETNRSIYLNATAHRDSDVILKLDFTDFFPSIKPRDWEKIVLAGPSDGIDTADIKLYSKILFWGYEKRSTVPRCLSIGAPTSPRISNIVMFRFDTVVSARADALGLIYTRYADDITISGNDPTRMESLEREIRKLVKQTSSPRLSFNEEKRGLYRKGQRRMVTGLVITPQKEISIGRERKRKILALLHRSSLNQLDEQKRSLLKGLLGFCAAVEPNFLGRLRTKYGDGVVNTAMKFHAPKRQSIIAPPPPNVF